MGFGCAHTAALHCRSLPASGAKGSLLARPIWDPAGVQVWADNGVMYEINSMYLVPDDAWTYELTGPAGTAAEIAVVIPDATPHDEQFTPSDSTHAHVAVANGPLPWPVLRRFIRTVETSGDIVSETVATSVTGDLSLSLNSWCFESRTFEVNSFHDGRRDGWCYELYEVDPTNDSNDYVDVHIPDRQPADGPFVPAAARHVVLTGHGRPRFPWPVFRHFLDAIAASGDIVEDSGTPMT